MITQKELAYQFAWGYQPDEIPRASNVEVRKNGGDEYIVGYGHAIYAARLDGDLVLYEGWRGYSISTSCQMTELRKGFEKAGVEFDADDEARPQDRHGKHPEK